MSSIPTTVLCSGCGNSLVWYSAPSADGWAVVTSPCQSTWCNPGFLSDISVPQYPEEPLLEYPSLVAPSLPFEDMSIDPTLLTLSGEPVPAPSPAAAPQAPLTQETTVPQDISDASPASSPSPPPPGSTAPQPLPESLLSGLPENLRFLSLSTSGVRIKRAPNMWILYRGDKSRELKAANPRLRGPEVSKRAAECWRREPESVKRHYAELARQANEQHKRLHPDYKYHPRQRRTEAEHE